MKILDCTIRDGGYYNHWDFSLPIAEKYFRSMNQLPIDILEIGYRSRPQKNYEGKYFYCPDFVIEQARNWAPSKELAIMLNEKDCRIEDLDYLLTPCNGLINTIRMAIAPSRFLDALELAEGIKKRGFKVGFNIMYMSTLSVDTPFFNHISKLNGLVDYFSLVDSYGGIYPEKVREIIGICKSATSIPIGFHGHNNIELAFANSLSAIEAGCELVDATIMGMGRGAGNLKTELWLTHCSTKEGLNVDFNILGELVSQFEELQNVYQWGTNLPYMVSGANSLPQKDVMDWVTKRFYSINSIIRALHNQKNGEQDNLKLPEFMPENKLKRALVVGGGPSILEHLNGLLTFLRNNPDIGIVHASSKHANIFRELPNRQFYCLVGNEGHRMENVFNGLENVTGECILPPFPRKMGTYLPNAMKARSFELRKVLFNNKIDDSHTALALQVSIDLGVDTIYIAGYDGYPNQSVSGKEQDLINENNYLFNKAITHFKSIAAITPSRYEINEQLSLYQLVS